MMNIANNDYCQKANKKAWNIEEDAKLMTLIDEFGANGSWTLISAKMGNRSGKQCRERYHNHLNPDIRKASWTKEEDLLLNDLQRKLGNQWAKIAKYLNGRSDNAVKNRWHIINRGKPQVPVGPRAHPLVPVLSLGTVIDTSGKIDDLQSAYHNHSEHGHEILSSFRSCYSCPSSGRNNSIESVTPRFVIPYVSDVITCNHPAVMAATTPVGCDAWIDALMNNSDLLTSDDDWSQDDDSAASHIMSIEPAFVFSGRASSRAEPVSSRAMMEVDFLQMIDRFSEAAMSARDEDVDCDFQLFDPVSIQQQAAQLTQQPQPQQVSATAQDSVKNSLQEQPQPVTKQPASPCYGNLSKMAQMVMQQKLEHNTPRSPLLCANVKRQRPRNPCSPMYSINTNSSHNRFMM